MFHRGYPSMEGRSGCRFDLYSRRCFCGHCIGGGRSACCTDGKGKEKREVKEVSHQKRRRKPRLFTIDVLLDAPTLAVLVLLVVHFPFFFGVSVVVGPIRRAWAAGGNRPCGTRACSCTNVRMALAIVTVPPAAANSIALLLSETLFLARLLSVVESLPLTVLTGLLLAIDLIYIWYRTRRAVVAMVLVRLVLELTSRAREATTPGGVAIMSGGARTPSTRGGAGDCYVWVGTLSIVTTLLLTVVGRTRRWPATYLIVSAIIRCTRS